MSTGYAGRMLGPATSHEVSSTTLLRVARQCHQALSWLSVGPSPTPPVAVVLLAGHELETGLKAFLVQIGWSEKRITRLGHDLARAWTSAERGGLPVDVDPPWWCKALSSAYDRPFLARYPPTNSGLVLPNLAQLVHDLGMVLDEVANQIVVRGGTV